MQQVADWLQKLGLGQYAQPFAENDISFSILLDLTDQDLKELGVASLGHRRQLLRAIAEMKGVEIVAPKLINENVSTVAPQETAERFVGLRVTEICKDTVAHVGRHKAAKTLHGFRNAPMVGRNDLAKVFRVHAC